MKTIGSDLQQDVVNELQWDPIVQGARVGVTVEQGVVVLAGSVSSLAERAAAEQAAKRVRGVRSVVNDLQVALLSTHVRDDVQIARAAQDALQWNVVVPDDKLKVTVSKGWLTLEGEVPFDYQRKAAATSVMHLIGVLGVTNRITVRPSAPASDVQRCLSEALHRYAQLEAEHLQAERIGSRVVLSGKVRSWAERQVAEDAAWAAPGIDAVDNRIEVSS